jgi:hypothetical protein
MPIGKRRLTRTLLAVLTTAAATATVGLTNVTAAYAAVNTSRNYVVVYNNNIENMVRTSCYGDNWNLLFNYIKSRPLSPDIFTVQQISNIAQLNALTTRMTNELPGTYASVIAIENPGSMGYDSDCGKLKNQQTNAVIYRSDRFTLMQTTRWRSDAPENPKAGTGPCRNLEPTESSQDRAHNVGIRLRDNVRGEDVSVASIHWPTDTWHAHDCAEENMNEANDAMERLGGTLKIVTGDFNIKPSSSNWWKDARDFGFRDPIAEKCGAANCSSAYNTTENSRIDLMFVKSGNGFSNVSTITQAMAGGDYSDHRAITSYVNY